MELYTCTNCNKKFKRKANYVRHFERKYPCKKMPFFGNQNEKLMKVDEKSMKVDEKSMKVDEKSMKVDEKSMKVDEKSMKVDKKSMKVDKKKNELKEMKIIKNYQCNNCNKKFKKKSYLDVHLKKYCKMNINFNNIYKFNNSTFGKKKYGSNGGDIYIVQTDHNFNDIFKIGKTTNLYNRLKDYRCGAVIEPRLYFYYPFKDIKKADNDIKILLSEFRVKREIYKCDIEKIRYIILKYQEKVDNCKIENEPIIKETDLSECEHCEKLFYTKKEMFTHLKNCENYRFSFTNNGEYNCKYCHKKFNHKSNYYRHMKHYCKEKNTYDGKMKEELEKEELEKEELEKEIEELKRKVDELKMSQHVTYNNNNNNITLIAHNKQPDLSHLTNNDYLKIMNRGFNSVPKLIEAIHFNPEKPENQNIYIPDIKNKYVMAWNGKEWNLRDRNNIIDDMYDDNSNILLEKMEELDEGENKFKKFKRFINQCENDIVKDRVKEEIKLLLYNKKNSVFK
jgi:hypothetical protein